MKITMLLLLIFSLLLGSTENAAAASSPKRVTLLTLFGASDVENSYNYLCTEGLRHAAERFGKKKLITASVNINDAALAERTLDQAASASDLVIITADAFLKFLPEAVKKYPDCSFITVGCQESKLPQVKEIAFRDEEGGFLAGALAALITEKSSVKNINSEKIIGLITGKELESVKDFEKGYRAGAWYIDPEIKVLKESINSFSDALLAGKAAEKLHTLGADVIFSVAGVSQNGAAEVARDGGFWIIGADTELEEKYPESVLTSAVKRIDSLIYWILVQYVKGKIPVTDLSVGIKENCLDLSLWTRAAKLNIPVDIRQRVEAIADKLADGLIKIKAVESGSLR